MLPRSQNLWSRYTAMHMINTWWYPFANSPRRFPPPRECPNGIRALAVWIGTTMTRSGSDRCVQIREQDNSDVKSEVDTKPYPQNWFSFILVSPSGMEIQNTSFSGDTSRSSQSRIFCRFVDLEWENKKESMWEFVWEKIPKSAKICQNWKKYGI